MAHFLGLLAPIGLVLIIEFVPEGLARCIEGHRKVVGLFLLYEFEQHAREPVDGVEREPARIAQVLYGMKRAIRIRMPVYQVDTFLSHRWSRAFRAAL